MSSEVKLLQLERLERSLGYHFDDPGLVEKALTHRSMGSSNNERLEFLGDAILGFVVAEQLCADHGKAKEGELSRLRAGLVKGDTLAQIARSLNIGDYLILGPGELRSGGHTRASILADAMEALFAAVYLDGGMDAVKRVILDLLNDRLANLSLDNVSKDPKTRLQEFLQGRKFTLPEYVMDSVCGEPHHQTFTVTCRVDELKISQAGVGSSRRKAEQAAAKAVLDKL